MELNIFCSFKNEERFFKINKKLFKNNIKYHGEIDINSKIFLKTLNKSMFSIQASVGEGQSSSIVNTTSLGLMPVLSRKSGQRFKFKYIEIDIDNNSKLELQIKNLLKIPINKLRSEVIDNTGICFKYYSIKNYDTKMMENLSLILKNIK